MQREMNSNNNRIKVILASTALSLGFGLLVACVLVLLDILHSGWGLVIAFVTFSLLNPVIGKVFVAVGLRLCNGVDEVFHLPQKKNLLDYAGRETEIGGFRCGGWSSNIQILLAASWLITGPIIWLLASIALIFGLLFQSLFKS